MSRHSRLVGCTIWGINLGRFDDKIYVSTMGRCNVTARKRNIGAMARIFDYLKHHKKYRIIYNNRLLDDQREVNMNLKLVGSVP